MMSKPVDLFSYDPAADLAMAVTSEQAESGVVMREVGYRWGEGRVNADIFQPARRTAKPAWLSS